MYAITNVTISLALEPTSHEEAGSRDRTLRVDWLVPITVNIILIVMTTLILVSLVRYGVTSGKWRGQPVSQADRLNAGVVYTFLIVCAVMCIARFLVNQLYMNVGFHSDEDALCEAAGDAAFTSYSMILWSVSMFLWFRQKAFYTNNMHAFKATKCIRAFSFCSIFLINAGGTAYLLFFTIPRSYKAGIVGCVYKAEGSLRLFYGIYVALLFVFSHLVLLCLFIYPVLQIGRSSQTSLLKKACCFDASFLTRSHLEESGVCSNTEPSGDESSNSVFVARGRSLAVRPPSHGIKRVIRKTLFFAVVSIFLDVIISMISHFLSPPSGNRRFINMMFDLAGFCNFLFLIFSFSTYKIMLTSCIRRGSTK